jgi:uncharacterized coiled-coil protein SlyX
LLASVNPKKDAKENPNMKIKKTIQVFAYLVVLAMCQSGTALAQSTNKAESVAAVAADRGEVRWQPQVEYSRLILTVSAPGGEVFRKEFEAGTTPSFKLSDKDGYSLPDGSYSYELRVIPHFSREVRKALAASREKGNTAEVMQELQKSGQLPTTLTVQSGSFLIEKGAVLTGSPEDGEEPGQNSGGGANELQRKKKAGGAVTILDVVHADDVIIQGSLCVGLDCVNGEVFGFDTIRLKENNTRIQFDDTSAAGFPTNNWQIRANSSAAGGASFLGFVDQGAAGNSETGTIVFEVDAGAPANSLKVSSTGRVGLRTATPVLDLHIDTSNTPATRLEQNGSGGFTAQTWDIAGNEANFFVRDVTGGSRLPFRIRPGAPTSSIDISASGNVGVGTASPSGLLHLLSTSTNGTSFFFQNSDTGGKSWRMLSTGTNNSGGAGIFGLVNATDDPNNYKVVVTPAGNVGIGTATPGGKLDVNGTIFQRGILIHADYVFEPTYNLESIEDHSAFMWSNKHLPAVDAKQVDEQGREVVEIGARMRGMLEEIEKAHIYISTLSDKITEKDAALAKLERQNTELAERLARIEAMLAASKSEKESLANRCKMEVKGRGLPRPFSL